MCACLCLHLYLYMPVEARGLLTLTVFLCHLPFYFLRHGLSIQIWSLLLQLRLTGQHTPGICLSLPLLSFPAMGSQTLSATPSFYVAVRDLNLGHQEVL